MGSRSGMSVTTTSDVRNVLATDAAFSSSHLTTCKHALRVSTALKSADSRSTPAAAVSLQGNRHRAVGQDLMPCMHARFSIAAHMLCRADDCCCCTK